MSEVVIITEAHRVSEVKSLCKKALNAGEFDLKFKQYPNQEFKVQAGFDDDHRSVVAFISNDHGDSAVIYASVNIKTKTVTTTGGTHTIVNYPSIY